MIAFVCTCIGVCLIWKLVIGAGTLPGWLKRRNGQTKFELLEGGQA